MGRHDVIIAPGVEYALGFDGGREDVGVQTFVAQPAVKAFDERILDRLAGPNELEPNVVRVRPFGLKVTLADEPLRQPVRTCSSKIWDLSMPEAVGESGFAT